MKIHLLDMDASTPTSLLRILSCYNQIKRLPYWARSDCFYPLNDAETAIGPTNLSNACRLINSTWNSSIPRSYSDNRGSYFQLSTMVHFRHKITPLSKKAKKTFTKTYSKDKSKEKYLIKRGYK